MWILTIQPMGRGENEVVAPLVVREEDAECTTYLLSRKRRKGKEKTTMVVPGDPSISRKHAEIRVQRTSGTMRMEERPEVFFTDLSSKCGSFRNGEKLIPDIEHRMDNYSNIIIGANNTTLRVTWRPGVFVFSSLPTKEMQQEIQTTVSKIGGRMERTWADDATHLIMVDIRATPKLILALVGCKHVVTPDFLHAIISQPHPDAALPNEANFLPPIKDAAIHHSTSFAPQPRRKTLFQGKCFAFLHKSQYDKLGGLIVAASGLPVLYDTEQRAREKQADLKWHLRPDVIVVRIHGRLISPANREWVEHIKTDLRRHHLRPVNEQEITYAILNVATDIMCNPTVPPDKVLEIQSKMLGVPAAVKPQVEAALATARVYRQAAQSGALSQGRQALSQQLLQQQQQQQQEQEQEKEKEAEVGDGAPSPKRSKGPDGTVLVPETPMPKHQPQQFEQQQQQQHGSQQGQAQQGEAPGQQSWHQEAIADTPMPPPSAPLASSPSAAPATSPPAQTRAKSRKREQPMENVAEPDPEAPLVIEADMEEKEEEEEEKQQQEEEEEEEAPAAQEARATSEACPTARATTTSSSSKDAAATTTTNNNDGDEVVVLDDDDEGDDVAADQNNDPEQHQQQQPKQEQDQGSQGSQRSNDGFVVVNTATAGRRDAGERAARGDKSSPHSPTTTATAPASSTTSEGAEAGALPHHTRHSRRPMPMATPYMRTPRPAAASSSASTAARDHTDARVSGTGGARVAAITDDEGWIPPSQFPTDNVEYRGYVTQGSKRSPTNSAAGSLDPDDLLDDAASSRGMATSPKRPRKLPHQLRNAMDEDIMKDKGKEEEAALVAQEAEPIRLQQKRFLVPLTQQTQQRSPVDTVIVDGVDVPNVKPFRKVQDSTQKELAQQPPQARIHLSTRSEASTNDEFEALSRAYQAEEQEDEVLRRRNEALLEDDAVVRRAARASTARQSRQSRQTSRPRGEPQQQPVMVQPQQPQQRRRRTRRR